MQNLYQTIERGSYVYYKKKVPPPERSKWNVFSSPPVSNKDREMPTKEEIYGNLEKRSMSYEKYISNRYT